MSLPSGQTLAHYAILDAIGKGGMGEVYRAKDAKLGRDVAINVLPDEFARDEERLARFKREGKVLAALNQPNIASIYGLEESGGTHFLVLEFVDGETLPSASLRVQSRSTKRCRSSSRLLKDWKQRMTKPSSSRSQAGERQDRYESAWSHTAHFIDPMNLR